LRRSTEIVDRPREPRHPADPLSLRLHLAVAWVFLVLLGPASALATSISAEVDKRALRVGETLRYVLQVKVDLKDGVEPARVEPPDLSAWDVVSQQQRQTNIGGRSDQRLTLSLQPRQAGRLKIEPFVLYADGKTLKSPAFTVLVTGAAPGTATLPGVELFEAEPPPTDRRPTSLPPGAFDNLVFLAWEVDRAEVWLGQPITATLWAYVNAQISVRQSNIGNIDLDGFWRESRPPSRGAGESVNVRNARFVRSPVAQYVLVPLRAGELSLPAVKADFVVGNRSLFGAQGGQAESREAARKPIRVRALPEAGKPPGFRGPAVGKVRLEATVDQAVVDAERGLELTATTTVDGHIDHVPTPALETPDFTVYPPTDVVQRAQQGGRLVGQRVTRWQLRPKRLGALTIPALRLPHFEPESGTWQVAVTAPIQVDVRGTLASVHPPSAAPTGPAAPATGPGRAEGALTEARPTLAPLLPVSDLAAPPVPWHTEPLYWVLVAVAPGLFVTRRVRSFLSARRDASAGARAVRDAAASAQRTLAELGRQPAGREGFSALSRVLVTFIEVRFEVTARGLTHDVLRCTLMARGLGDEPTQALVRELENCEFARFAPEADRPQVLGEALQRSRELIARLDREVV